MKLFRNVFKKSLKKQEPQAPITLLPRNILVVDDATINRFVLIKYLNRLFPLLNIDEASSGFQALKMTDTYKYDIIFMDIKMPMISGIETTIKLRAKGVTSCIVGVTGQTNENSIAIDSGMDKCIGKPVILSELEEIVLKLYNTRL